MFMLLRSQRGVGKVKALIVLALLGAALHVGFKIVPVYMAKESMEDTMSTKAGLAQVLKDQEILNDLVNKAKDLDLPMTAEDFVLMRDVERRKMTIKTQWDVEVNFFGGLYVYTYHFEPVVEENFMKGV